VFSKSKRNILPQTYWISGEGLRSLLLSCTDQYFDSKIEKKGTSDALACWPSLAIYGSNHADWTTRIERVSENQQLGVETAHCVRKVLCQECSLNKIGKDGKEKHRTRRIATMCHYDHFVLQSWGKRKDYPIIMLHPSRSLFAIHLGKGPH